MRLKIRTILRLVNAAKQLDCIPSTSNPQYFKNKIAEMDNNTLAKITKALDEIRFATRDIYTESILQIMEANKITFRLFKKQVYLSYGGAESFTSEYPPMIGSIKIDGQSGDVVVDKGGVGLFWGADAPDDVNNIERGGWYCTHAGVVLLLKPQMTLAEIKSLGFAPV